MKKIRRPLSLAGSVLLALALTLVLTGLGGLAFYFYQSPETFLRVTAPIRSCAQQLGGASQRAWDFCSGAASAAARDAADQIRSSLQTLSAPPEPELELDEVQLVDGFTLAQIPRSESGYAVTALAARSGHEYLTGGIQEIIYYNQTNRRWADQPYGSDRIGGYGCGPTVMAMVVSTLTDEDMDPAQMAQYCVDHGYWASRHGSYRTIVTGVSQDFGLTCASLTPEETNYDTVSRELAAGHIIVALMGPGHFTTGGHFILLRGFSLDGSVLVADPASSERSLVTWDLELILSELSASRDSGGPLWTVYTDPFS